MPVVAKSFDELMAVLGAGSSQKPGEGADARDGPSGRACAEIAGEGGFNAFNSIPAGLIWKASSFDEMIEKFNPYHDQKGRFSSSGGAASFTYKPGASVAHDKAIARARASAAAADAAAEEEKKYKKFSADDDDGMKAYISKTSVEQQASWNKSEKMAMQQYTGWVYKPINKQMRHENEADLPFDQRNIVHDLQTGLAKSSLPDDLMVYRGLGFTASQTILRQMGINSPSEAVGHGFMDRAFGSSSLDSSIAESFASHNIVMELKLPKGTKAVVTGENSNIPEENEIIIQRGARYKITGYRHDGKRSIWSAELTGTD